MIEVLVLIVYFFNDFLDILMNEIIIIVVVTIVWGSIIWYLSREKNEL